MSVPSYMNERWFSLLADAVARNPNGRAGVSVRLGAGFGRSMISLVLAGKYKSPVGKLSKRVLEVFDRYPCPYLGTDIAAEVCREVNSGPEPVWDPAAMDQRDRCQTCRHKPKGDAQ